MKDRKKIEKTVGGALISSVLFFVGIKVLTYFILVTLERVMKDA